MGPPHPLSSRQARLSCSSTATHSGSSASDSRKALHRKENQFIYRNGSKLHAYDRDKAPYPSSFDRDVVELQCLDLAMMLKKSHLSFVQRPPKRCLDIGSGLGAWVVAAAKIWPETTFVGLDMVNIQIPLQALDPEIADRIEWVHTNILRNKLPFEDEEFDLVHIHNLALGIPENKWHGLYEEIRRVMKPGAVIEHIEEDAIFPTLPRWYTDALRAHSRSLSTVLPGSPEQRLSYPQTTDSSLLTHEHELLEYLFEDVWTNRFINPTPTSIVPGYFSAFFDRVLSTPLSLWPTPPLPPFVPVPGMPEVIPAAQTPLDTDGIDHYTASGKLPTDVPNDTSLSTSPSSTLPTLAETAMKNNLSPTPSMTSLDQEIARAVTLAQNNAENASTRSLTSRNGSPDSASSKMERRPSLMVLATEDSTTLGGSAAAGIIPMDLLYDKDDASLYVHLYRSVTWVLSTKEAMWDELLVRVQARDARLKRFGWRDEDYDELASRNKFEYAFDLYQSDMRGRIALWNCCVQNGWELPMRDPPSKAELMEEMSLRREIKQAQRLADTGEPEPPCRRWRLLIGYKEL